MAIGVLAGVRSPGYVESRRRHGCADADVAAGKNSTEAVSGPRLRVYKQSIRVGGATDSLIINPKPVLVRRFQ